MRAHGDLLNCNRDWSQYERGLSFRLRAGHTRKRAHTSIVVPQVTTLPDPKFTYQQFSVGSPKPFAGYTNSDFAYIGIGASQELHYPGKLRLRGQVAERDADTKQAEIGVTRANFGDAVKADYLQLAYLRQTLGILRQNEVVLDQLIQDAAAHYQVGQGMQQDVLEAQVNRTKIVREITMHHQQMGMLQAHLKSLLNRDQASPDIVTEDMNGTPLKLASSDLLALVRQNNPQTFQQQTAADINNDTGFRVVCLIYWDVGKMSWLPPRDSNPD